MRNLRIMGLSSGERVRYEEVSPTSWQVQTGLTKTARPESLSLRSDLFVFRGLHVRGVMHLEVYRSEVYCIWRFTGPKCIVFGGLQVRGLLYLEVYRSHISFLVRCSV